MKFTVEIPDEDLDKIKILMKEDKMIAEFWDYQKFIEYLQELFNILGEDIMKITYEGVLAIKSGVISPAEYMDQMAREGMRLGFKAEIEIEKRSKDKASQTKEG